MWGKGVGGNCGKVASDVASERNRPHRRGAGLAGTCLHRRLRSWRLSRGSRSWGAAGWVARRGRTAPCQHRQVTDDAHVRPTDADLEMLRRAVELSRRCPPSATAFSVGAVIVDADGHELATGYSREDDPHAHAEECALSKLTVTLAAGVTIYSSLEPCSSRASRPDSCASLIVASGIRRVVFAFREPVVFVDGRGAEMLAAAGVTVVEAPQLADDVRDVNAHLLR